MLYEVYLNRFQSHRDCKKRDHLYARNKLGLQPKIERVTDRD